MKKKKENKNKNKRKPLMVVAGFDYETRALPLSYRNHLQPHRPTLQNMYLYSIWRLGPYNLRPVQSHFSVKFMQFF